MCSLVNSTVFPNLLFSLQSLRIIPTFNVLLYSFSITFFVLFLYIVYIFINKYEVFHGLGKFRTAHSHQQSSRRFRYRIEYKIWPSVNARSFFYSVVRNRPCTGRLTYYPKYCDTFVLQQVSFCSYKYLVGSCQSFFFSIS